MKELSDLARETNIPILNGLAPQEYYKHDFPQITYQKCQNGKNDERKARFTVRDFDLVSRV